VVRGFFVLIAAMLLCPNLRAGDIHNWGNVRKLKRGTPVLIVPSSGANVSGRFESATDSGMRVAVPDRRDPRAASIRTIDRRSVRRVVREAKPVYLPNPKHWMIAGAVAGGTAGVIAGAAEDATEGNDGHWFTKGVAGAGAGVLAVSVASLALAAVQIPRFMSRREKIIFESQNLTGAAVKVH
jgi:hypothetical protein